MTPRVRRLTVLGLAALFCLCVFFKVNGSSVGVWSGILLEQGKPPGLLFSNPKYIRGDEWHVWTPAALSQARQTPPFPIENVSLGGRRAPLVMNVPVAYYTMLFRPQLWGFFIFDFERGFSFYWCCKVFALLLASLWFLRQLGLRSNALVMLGTLWLFFSGYTQWWFSSPTMLPEMLATWMICTASAMRFFTEPNRWRLLAASALFVFCGTNFVLSLYPPYQIPLLFLMAAILIGTCVELRRAHAHCPIRRGMLILAASVATIVLVLIPFWLDVRATLEIIAHTDYPGARRSSGGDLSLFKLFSGIAGFFQSEKTFPKIYENVCEASNFYPLWPLVLVALVAAHWRRFFAIPPLLLALCFVILSFSLYCVVPLPAWLLRATCLEFGTERRMLLAIGLANILLCLIFLDRYRQQIFPKWGAATAGFLFCLAIGGLFWTADLARPGLFQDHRQLAVALAANGAIVFLFFAHAMRRWLLPVLTILLVLSNLGVNPIMHGLAPLLRSKAFHEVDQLRASDPQARWLAYNDFVLPQLVIATGAPTLNGNKTVPDFKFLGRFDPEGAAKPVYNRFAFVKCELPDATHGAGVEILQYDSYDLYLPPQAPILADLGVRFFLFPDNWPEADSLGFTLVKEIPESRISVYRRSAPNRQ